MDTWRVTRHVKRCAAHQNQTYLLWKCMRTFIKRRFFLFAAVRNVLKAKYPKRGVSKSDLEDGLHGVSAGRRDVEHGEVSHEASGERVAAATGRCACARQHHVQDLLPVQLVAVVHAAEVQELPAGL